MRDMLLLSIMTFVLLHCRHIYSFLLFVIGIWIYQKKYHRLHIYHIGIMGCIYIMSLSSYSILNNCVLETHEHYVVASVDHQKVMIYTDELYFETEHVEVEQEAKEIRSLSNFHLFNFQSYLNQQNISSYYEQALIFPKDSLKRKMYTYIMSKDENVKNDLLAVFYQFQDDHSLYSSGLHFSYLNQLFIQGFSLFVSPFLSYLFSSVMVLLFGGLFPWKFSMFRILFRNIVELFGHHLSLKQRIGLQYLLCMLFFPQQVFSMSFVIPYGLSLIRIFVMDQSQKKKASLFFLIFSQLLKTGKCSLFYVAFFSVIQKFNALCLLMGFVQLFSSFSFLQVWIEKSTEWLNFFNSLMIRGSVSYLVGILFMICFYHMLHQKKIASICCILLLLLIPFQSVLNPCYQVTFINVGQGDSILIQAPFHLNNVLIDIPAHKEQVVIDYLHSIGVFHLDTLVFTHDDSDHNGGKEFFLEQFCVKHVIEESENISFLHTEWINLNQREHDNENDDSAVYVTPVGRLSYCLMADTSQKVEQELLNQYSFQCDVVKVGHHGSKTSTSPSFIQQAQPKIGIISVGYNNVYGHPHQEVMDILKRYDVKTYLTSENGAICIKSFLFFHFITTSSGEFGIILA